MDHFDYLAELSMPSVQGSPMYSELHQPTPGRMADMSGVPIRPLDLLLERSGTEQAFHISGFQDSLNPEQGVARMDNIGENMVLHNWLAEQTYQTGKNIPLQPNALMNPLTFWIIDPETNWEFAVESVESLFTTDEYKKFIASLVPPADYCHYSYCFFKVGIRPEWEDSQNAMGGRWSISRPLSGDLANRVWDTLCQLFVDNAELDAVNGVYFSCRPEEKKARASAWLNTTDSDTVLRVGKLIQDVLHERTDQKFRMEFTEFKPQRGRKTALYTMPH